LDINELNELFKIFRECVDEYMQTLTKITMRYVYKEVLHLARKECIPRSVAKFIWHRYPNHKRALYSWMVQCFWSYFKHKDIGLLLKCINKFFGD